MIQIKQTVFLSFLFFSVCISGFWGKSNIQSTSSVSPDPSAMNQNLNLTLNISPKQFKTSFEIPKNWHVPIDRFKNFTTNFLNEKKYLLLGCTLLGGYCYICSFCVKGNKYLERTDTWASWKNSISYDALTMTSQEDLARELVLEIQRRYSSIENPTDFILPLISFIHSIDQEIETTQKLATAYTWFCRLHIQNLVPINEKLYQNIQNLHKKLIYLKNIFLSWAAEYKINHNKHQRRIPAYSISML